MVNLNIPLNYLNRNADIASPMESFNESRNMAGEMALSDLMSNPALSGADKMQGAIPMLGKFDPRAAIDLQQTALSDDREQKESEAKMDIARAKMLLSSGTKADIKELEQLWKDADRSLRFARTTGDKTSADFYQGLQGRLQAKLKTLRPDIWGGDSVDSGGDGGPANKTDISGIKAEIKPLLVDKVGNNGRPDGILDNVADVADRISEWARENDIPTTDPAYKSLLALVEAKDKELGRIFSQSENKRKEYKDDNKEYSALASEYGTLIYDYNGLFDSPNNISKKSSALTSVLRKESGAAIGESEYLGRMKSWLTPDNFQNLISELTSLKAIVGGQLMGSGYDTARLESINARYLDKVNASDILPFIKRIIDKRLHKELKGSSKKATPTKKANSMAGF